MWLIQSLYSHFILYLRQSSGICISWVLSVPIWVGCLNQSGLPSITAGRAAGLCPALSNWRDSMSYFPLLRQFVELSHSGSGGFVQIFLPQKQAGTLGLAHAGYTGQRLGWSEEVLLWWWFIILGLPPCIDNDCLENACFPILILS
ncbi:hypothetical protein NPIL_674591 [Nephila pilipes]|uniref:Uncharacterized protein n=1 Tax=Nephila pilipes TaxID=299642 RepID=A0A8X6QUM4_NEPPI|nr:hypothetical protein NPIL_674591 [Nephila pilipes]